MTSPRTTPPIAVYAMLCAFTGLGTALALNWTQPGLGVSIAAIAAAYLTIVAGGVDLAKRRMV